MEGVNGFAEAAIASFGSTEKMDKTVEDYQDLVSLAQGDEGFSSAEFKSKFTGFYVLRRNEAFRERYYDLLAQNDGNEDLTIEEVIDHLRHAPGNIELSFASKLLSMLNDKNPIWDANVEAVLKEVHPERMREIAGLTPEEAAPAKYQLLKVFYRELHDSGWAERMEERFDATYPQAEGFPINRKIDFILWNHGMQQKSAGKHADDVQ